MKSQGQEEGDCIKVCVLALSSVRCTCIYMHVCLSKCERMCLQVVNQRPYVQGCKELIADPSNVAHRKQNKKTPTSEKNPAERISKVQCCTVHI